MTTTQATTNLYDVIEVTSDHDDYPAEDLGKIAVQYGGQWIAFAEDLDAAAALIAARTGRTVRLDPADNYFSGRRWTVTDAQANAAAANLPAIKGTEKQIKWAEDIRREQLAKWDAWAAKANQAIAEEANLPNPRLDLSAATEAAIDAVTAELTSQTDAGWWIDRRNEPIGHQMFRELRGAARRLT